MATLMLEKKVKCFQCKVLLYARVKVDSKTDKVKAYVNIGGGTRRTAPSGYTATYCDFCAKKLDEERNLAKTFLKGERVKHLKKLEWGVGQVLHDSSGDAVRIYFVGIGEKKVLLKYGHLVRVQEGEAQQPLLDILNKICFNIDEHFSVYVIELRSEVMENQKFCEANQACDPLYPCVYVGLTGLSPEERFENHKIGYKSSYYSHKFGEKYYPIYINVLILCHTKMLIEWNLNWLKHYVSRGMLFGRNSDNKSPLLLINEKKRFFRNFL